MALTPIRVLSPLFVATGAALCAVANGLFAIFFLAPQDIESWQKIDKAVRFLFGVPAFVVVRHGLTERGAFLRPHRVAILWTVLPGLIIAEQTVISRLSMELLLYARDQGMSFTELYPIYTVTLPIAVTVLTALSSWASFVWAAGRQNASSRRQRANRSDLFAGILSISLGFVLCVEWIDSRLLAISWQEFFPQGLAELAKISAAVFFGGIVTLGLRLSKPDMPAIPWAFGAPWAACAAASALLGSGLLLHAATTNNQFEPIQALIGVLLATGMCGVACALPIKLLSNSK
jgi:hypothetical protein